MAGLVMKLETQKIDILGLGVIAVDDLIFVPSYPPADAKIPVSRRERHCGGLTATALVAAARLGCHCSYAGVLGSTTSKFAIERLSQEGISFTHLIRRTRRAPSQPRSLSMRVRKPEIFFDLHGFVGADDTARG
jgi:sugar/nucleoside kinase (ribokinase family)